MNLSNSLPPAKGDPAAARPPRFKVKRLKSPPGWRRFTYHPFSELVEFGTSIDLEGLTAHVQRHGYDASEPIILFDGQILDGRHRHTAAVHAEVEPTFMELV